MLCLSYDIWFRIVHFFDLSLGEEHLRFVPPSSLSPPSKAKRILEAGKHPTYFTLADPQDNLKITPGAVSCGFGDGYGFDFRIFLDLVGLVGLVGWYEVKRGGCGD